MNVLCSSDMCPVILNSTCVFYEGDTLLYTGITANDNLQTALQKIDATFGDAQIGYAFTNGIIQPTPGTPVKLGGALVENTTIAGNYTLTFAGNLQAAKHITTGGTASQFVKGDGTLDSTAYQVAGNYITGLSGDVIASGAGVAAASLAVVNLNPGVFGSSTLVPRITVDNKGRVTNVTTTAINVPSGILSFVGDVYGSGTTGSPTTLTLETVNTNVYTVNSFLKFKVNAKGLVTGATPVTHLDIEAVLGYVPVPETRTITINGVTHDLQSNISWTIAAGVSGVTASAPLSSTGGVTPNISITKADATTDGYLSSADWNIFNNKQPAGSYVTTSRTISTTGPLQGGGDLSADRTLSITQAGASSDGYLSSTDWNTFNGKQAAGNYITALNGEATASGPGSATVTLSTPAVTSKLLTGVNITGGSIVDTDSILTAFGKVQNQINGLIGGSIYKGTWNASTNTPTITSGVGSVGWYYIVSVPGTTNIDGITDWNLGDWIIFDGTAWQQVDNTDAVVSVNGYTGAVSLVSSDVPEGLTNLYYTPARARTAISLTTTGSSGAATYDNVTGVLNVPDYGSSLTAYVPYTGATTNVNLGEHGVTAGYVGFDLTPTGTPTGVGTMYWDSAYRTVSLIDGDGDTTLQIGQEERILVHNNTGSPLTDGQVVYVTGSTGELPSVSLADASSETTSAATLGVVTESIANGADGFVTVSGIVHGLNTLAYNEGDLLWLSETAGEFTTTKPISPAHLVLIGYVIKKAGGNGSILVKIQNTQELAESSDVLISAPEVDGQGLFLQTISGTQLWRNRSITDVLGYTPVPTTRTLTINGTAYDLSADRSWTITSIFVPGTGTCSSIRCGVGNLASGNYSSALGGCNNTASGGYGSAVVGGICNAAIGNYSFVANGFGNAARGNSSFIGGGTGNVTCDTRTIVVGGENNCATTCNSFVGGGQSNCAIGFHSAVLGGLSNTASGTYSTVSGGKLNVAQCPYSFVGSGFNNTVTAGVALSSCSAIVGGGYNVIQSGYSFIGGGGGEVNIWGNTITGGLSSIVGGRANTVSSTYSFIGGGLCNLASSSYASIGGGQYNTASGTYSVVSGGQCNISNAYFSALVGGSGNYACGNLSFVGGGNLNIANGNYSSVVGGNNNTAYTTFTFVGGGLCNIACGTYSTISGGHLNTASGNYSFIGGGAGNTASGLGSFIGGGLHLSAGSPAANNIASGDYSFIGGGEGNQVSCYKSSIVGGDYNAIYESRGFIGGGNSNLICGFDSVIGGGQCNTLSTYSTMFSVIGGGNFNTSSAAYTTIAGGNCNTITAGSAFIGGGDFNTVSGYFGSVVGGLCNVASGNRSAIVGGQLNTASGCYAMVGAGCTNSATDGYTFVGGGGNNCATFSYATVGGGRFNKATAPSSAVAGGNTNLASGGYSFIGGGQNNTASANHSTVAGGRANTANGNCAFVGGGCSNVSGSAYSVVAGGELNQATGQRAFVGGGLFNCATACHASVVGGQCVLALGAHSSAGGGQNNTASGACATIAGGQTNLACADYAFVGGGRNNQAALNYATIAGGASNQAIGYWAFVGSGEMNCANNNYATVSGGYTNRSTGAYAFIGGGCYNNSCGNSSFVGGGYSNTASGSRSFVGGGQSNTASGNYSSIVGGKGNIVNSYSFASGLNNCVNSSLSSVSGAYNSTLSGGVNIHVLGACISGNTNNYTFVNNLCQTGGGISDRRTKNTICDTGFGLCDIVKLRPVSYCWNHDPTNSKKYGFIAQEVQEAIPSIVSYNEIEKVDKDGKRTITGEGDPVLQFEKEAVYASYVNAFKELKAENDALKAEIDGIKEILKRNNLF